MLVKVIQQHTSDYQNPISFKRLERVWVGQQDDEFPGWYWTTTADGNQGWAPEQLLQLKRSKTSMDEELLKTGEFQVADILAASALAAKPAAPTTLTPAAAPKASTKTATTEAIALADYSAHELDIDPGETLTVYKELNQWYWCSNQAGVHGWVPAMCVERI
ncbi:MAG: SH3 domain-containing protein [Deinococcota bacterium]